MGLGLSSIMKVSCLPVLVKCIKKNGELSCDSWTRIVLTVLGIILCVVIFGVISMYLGYYIACVWELTQARDCEDPILRMLIGMFGLLIAFPIVFGIVAFFYCLVGAFREQMTVYDESLREVLVENHTL